MANKHSTSYYKLWSLYLWFYISVSLAQEIHCGTYSEIRQVSNDFKLKFYYTMKWKAEVKSGHGSKQIMTKLSISCIRGSSDQTSGKVSSLRGRAVGHWTGSAESGHSTTSVRALKVSRRCSQPYGWKADVARHLAGNLNFHYEKMTYHYLFFRLKVC